RKNRESEALATKKLGGDNLRKGVHRQKWSSVKERAQEDVVRKGGKLPRHPSSSKHRYGLE
ncbi:hypothetical protein Ancab_028907, partial [Ancistrocladus abbreviatus]